jgi:hypothetical protein
MKNASVRWCLAGVLCVLSLRGAPITLYFAGSSQAGTPTTLSLGAGTAFTGSVTFDPATPNNGSADSAHRDFFDPLATFNFHIGSGIYDFTTSSVGIQVEHNYGAPSFGTGDVIWFWANSATITGSGEGTNPIFSDTVDTVLLWRKTGDGIFSTANTINEPPMETLGSWTFAGIDLIVRQGTLNTEHYLLPFSTISQTAPAGPVTAPEPGTVGFVSAGLVAFTFGLRARSAKLRRNRVS